MTFEDFTRIVAQIHRLPSGCATGRTVNGERTAVVWLHGRCRSFRAVLRVLLYGRKRPAPRFCDTEGCIHPRHRKRRQASRVVA